MCKYTEEGSKGSIGQMQEEIKLRSIFSTQLSYSGRRRLRGGGTDGRDVQKERKKEFEIFFAASFLRRQFSVK